MKALFCIAVLCVLPIHAAEYPPLPEAFSSFGAITCDGYAYVYGGHGARTHSYSTESTLGKFRRLNLADPSRGWEELEGGVACQGLSLVAHKGKLYRLGGMRPRNAPGEKTDAVSLATCQVYDVKSGKWSSLPDLPTARSSFDAVVIGDTIIIAGGWQMKGAGQESEWATTALMLDLSKKEPQWESIPQPFIRRALTTVAHHGKMYVVGGLNSDDDIELSVNIFDPVTRTWKEGPDLPGPTRNGFSPATCTEGNRLYASPGDRNIYRLASDDASWESVGRIEQSRIVHRMLGNGKGTLFVLGGANRKENTAITETVRPAAPRK